MEIPLYHKTTEELLHSLYQFPLLNADEALSIEKKKDSLVISTVFDRALLNNQEDLLFFLEQNRHLLEKRISSKRFKREVFRSIEELGDKILPVFEEESDVIQKVVNIATKIMQTKTATEIASLCVFQLREEENPIERRALLKEIYESICKGQAPLEEVAFLSLSECFEILEQIVDLGFQITFLNLSTMNITDEDLVQLAPILGKMENLKVLLLCDNGIRSEEAQLMLYESLSLVKDLKKLYLIHNPLSGDGFCYRRSSLKVSKLILSSHDYIPYSI